MVEDGWSKRKVAEATETFGTPAKPGKVTVPFHGGRDLPLGTIRSIERQAGLDLLPKR